jgi:hypothetical protein
VIHTNWVPSAAKGLGKLYQWLVTDRLRDRSEEKARSAPTAAVIRSGVVELRWYEWPAARQLQREEHGAIEGRCYRGWVNVTPRGVLVAAQMRAMFSPPHHHDAWY